MPVFFPHANHQTIETLRFIAAWKVWFDQYNPDANWRVVAMPRLNAAVILQKQIENRKNFSLDVLCRYLVTPPYRNTMHATNPFMVQNQMIISMVNVRNPRTKRLVQGARLTEFALQSWDATPEQERNEQEQNIIALINADIEVGIEPEIMQANNETIDNPAAIVRNISDEEIFVSDVDDCITVLKKLVRWIHVDPFQPFYRRHPEGAQVTGWDNRLSAYFWPSPNVGYETTERQIAPLKDGLRILAFRLEDEEPWNDEEEQQAVQLAAQLFVWGGVLQNEVTAVKVKHVMCNALRGEIIHPQAPMNSGWTKVAAFATAHLEDVPGRYPQVIWDSRVSASIVSRLDTMFAHCPERARELFPNIGVVPGRGGTRPRMLIANWPSGYRSWAAQFAGSSLVAKMRNILIDQENNYPQMPLPGGERGQWTVRGVEMVLFGDGY